ncbi:hypothetical protein Q7P35_006879 [Cladosporium inversicolor]
MLNAEHLIIMLSLLALLLDLILIALASVLLSSNSPVLLSFGIGILVTTKLMLNTMLPYRLDQKLPPATAINALLQPTQAPQGDRCPVCLDDFFEPRKLSCNHIFCRDCALLMLCKRNACPLCQRVPVQPIEVEKSVPFMILFGVILYLVVGWIRNCFVLSVAWIVPCIWQLRLPTCADSMLVAMSATMHLALRTTVADLVPFIACVRSRPDGGTPLVDTTANIGPFAVTLSYDSAARFYLPLCVVLATCQYFDGGNLRGR